MEFTENIFLWLCNAWLEVATRRLSHGSFSAIVLFMLHDDQSLAPRLVSRNLYHIDIGGGSASSSGASYLHGLNFVDKCSSRGHYLHENKLQEKERNYLSSPFGILTTQAPYAEAICPSVDCFHGRIWGAVVVGVGLTPTDAMKVNGKAWR